MIRLKGGFTRQSLEMQKSRDATKRTRKSRDATKRSKKSRNRGKRDGETHARDTCKRHTQETHAEEIDVKVEQK